MKAFWNFYRDVSLFNLAFSVFTGFFTGIVWIPILFCTFGMLIGFLRFDAFLSNQYYFYHNLGFTKQKLAAMTFFINLVFALPVLLVIIFLT